VVSNVNDAQWFGPGSEKKQFSSHEEEKEEQPLPVGATGSPLLLPSFALSQPLHDADTLQSLLSSAGSNVAAALGREGVVATLSSLPCAAAGVAAPSLVGPRGGAHAPVNLAPTAALAAQGMACCGACFVVALQARAKSLSALAASALAERRAEQARVAQAEQAAAQAAAAAAAATGSSSPNPAHRKSASNLPGTGNAAGANKKKAAAPSGSAASAGKPKIAAAKH
jgi:hypothetical protein